MSRSEIARTILAAKAKPPATLAVRWSDGTRAAIDLSAMLREHDFRALRKGTAFARARVGEWGHSVEWPSGAELSAETLWLETLSATGRDDTRAFLEWRLRHGLSLTKAAEALGVSRRMVAYYSNGEKPVPRPILLACKGWEIVRLVKARSGGRRKTLGQKLVGQLRGKGVFKLTTDEILALMRGPPADADAPRRR